MQSDAAGSRSRKPKIGEPRIYTSDTVPVLYPGEKAQAVIDPDALFELVQKGGGAIPIKQWMVEPTPGPYAAWLRWKYRWFGWWWYRLLDVLHLRKPKAKLEVDMGVSGERSNRSAQRQ